MIPVVIYIYLFYEIIECYTRGPPFALFLTLYFSFFVFSCVCAAAARAAARACACSV